ncbi:MAG: iron-containing alcohol dehydrogenase [Thermoproteota archaeon]
MSIVLPRKILYGMRAPEALLELLREEGVTRVLVVTDKVVSSLEAFRGLVQRISEAGLAVTVFDEVEPEPSLDTARRVADLARAISAEAIVAVGGGSVIDAAKAGLALYEKPDLNLEEISPLEFIGVGKRVKLVAIPTTSGTGSDASFGVVLTKLEQDGSKRKLALGSLELVPWVTVLDEEFTLSMPPSLTRNTALDAFSHAVEAYVGVMANPLTDALAEKVVEIIVSRLRRVLEKPSDRESRRQIHLAATMAGMAFTNAGLGAAHAIAHALGPTLGLHHGFAVALVLPYVVEYNYSTSPDARSKYAKLEAVIEAAGGYKGKLYEQIAEFYRDVGQPARLSEIEGAPAKSFWESMIEAIAQKALEDPELAFNPAPVGLEEIKSILRRIY